MAQNFLVFLKESVSASTKKANEGVEKLNMGEKCDTWEKTWETSVIKSNSFFADYKYLR